jgi:hypothetical protein
MICGSHVPSGPGDLQGERALVRQHRRLAGTVAVIGGVGGRGPAGRRAQMVRQLAAEHPFQEGLLEATGDGVRFRLRHGPGRAGEVIEDLLREVRRMGFASPGHRYSSCYAPHTKFLTPSPEAAQAALSACGA